MPISETNAYFRVGPTEDNNIATSNWGTIPDYTPLFRASLGPDENDSDCGWKILNDPWDSHYPREFRVGLGTDMIDLDYDILDAGTFKFYANTPDAGSENPDAVGYIGSNAMSAGDRTYSPNMFTHQLHYKTEWIRSGTNYYRKIGSTQYQFQAPVDSSSSYYDDKYQVGGYQIMTVSSSGNDKLSKLLGGEYDGPSVSIYYRAASHKVYWTCRANTPYDRGYCFENGSYMYPESLITSASGESVYSNDTGWSVFGGDSPEQILADGLDETYVELEPGKKIVMKLEKPTIRIADFMETPNARGYFWKREAYTKWLNETYSNNYKYMEMRFASVTHDGINTRMDWWYDKDATLPDSRLRNTSTDVDISACPITVFGPDGTPTGDTTEVAWEQDSSSGLTVEQQQDHRVLIRNNSTTAGENVRISMARCRIGPGIFYMANPSKSYLEFTPSFGS